MSNLAAVPDDATALSTEVSELVVAAQGVTVTDASSRKAAIEFIKEINGSKNKITAFYEPKKQLARAPWAALCEEERELLTVPDRAVKIIKVKVIDFDDTEERRIAEETREREKKAKKLEEARRLQEAIDLEADGNAAAANEVLDAPVVVHVAAIPQPAAAKVEGSARTKRWTFDPQRVDLAAVLCHIVGVPAGTKLAHPELLRVIAINSAAIRQLITAMRDQFSVPGIAAYEEKGLSVGSN